MDDDQHNKAVSYTIGQDLAAMSVDELRKTAELLRREAERLEDEATNKQDSLSAAAELFRS